MSVKVYKDITAEEKFKLQQWRGERRKHDEAQALYNAARIERQKWQAIVAEIDAAIEERVIAIAEKDAAIAEKDAVLAQKDALIAELEAELKTVNT